MRLFGFSDVVKTLVGDLIKPALLGIKGKEETLSRIGEDTELYSPSRVG